MLRPPRTENLEWPDIITLAEPDERAAVDLRTATHGQLLERIFVLARHCNELAELWNHQTMRLAWCVLLICALIAAIVFGCVLWALS